MKTFALLVSALMAFAVTNLRAAETIPPKPAGYFNDYAGVVSKEAALRFNEQLAQFERETSNQVLVAVFRKMETDSSIEDYTQRIAQAWGVGKKDRKNGAVLFVFIEDRKMYIQVGYGLEGTLPDVTAFDITERHIKPHFKQNDYEGGLATGIDLICKAIRGGISTGNGKTQAGRRKPRQCGTGLIFIVFLVIILIATRMARRVAGYGYSSAGGRPFFGGWSSSGGGWSSGSSGGGGFSGFSGGGGSFGGAARVRAGKVDACTKGILISQLDHDRIVGAIKEAEAKTSGQIRVYVQRGNCGRPGHRGAGEIPQAGHAGDEGAKRRFDFCAAPRAQVCRDWRRGRPSEMRR